MADKNYYETLGVNKDASADDIKSAYRRLAKKYHPDLFATAPEAEKKEAEAKFKEIQHAYGVLSDPQKKAAYDQYGSEDGPTMGGAGFNPFGGGGGGFESMFSDIFEAFTGGGRSSSRNRVVNGDDVECTVNLTFKEACFGVKDKEIVFSRMDKCGACGGTGSSSPNGVKTCPKCNGSGSMTINQRTPFGVMQTRTTCDQCRGEGRIITDRCTHCYGKGTVKTQKKIKINVPAGVDNGNTMTLRGEGCVAPPNKGGVNGNLFLIFKVSSHPLFIREGIDISYELPITFIQAALGAKVTVPTLDGTTIIDIPEGTQNGTVIRVKGKGVKSLRKEVYGNMYVHVVVDVPRSLNYKQREALKNAEDALNKATYEKIEKFNKKVKGL